MAVPRLDRRHTAVLVVDVQEKLLPHMHDAASVLTQTARLLDGANALGLPIVVTEQYRKGLGVTVPELQPRIASAKGVHEKLSFSALIEPVRLTLDQLQARSVLVCGIESHVCVLQSCLDLAREGFIPFVVTDAITSRRPMDHAIALQRMIQAQIVPTTVESALLEIVREGGTSEFKSILPLIK